MKIKNIVAFMFFSVLIGLGTAASSADYPIGSKFKNILRIDFPSGKRSLPLPPGVWEMGHKWIGMSSGGADLTKILNFVLVRISEGKLTGISFVKTPIDLVDTWWRPSGLCENTKYRNRSNFMDGFGGRDDNEEECLVVNWLRGWKKRHKRVVPIVEYLSEKNIEWSEIPNGWINFRYYYTEADNLLRYRMYLPPEHYNFKRERKYGHSASPWMPNNIDQHPIKKKFMESSISWGKSWKSLIKKGFVDNQLSQQEVLNHPKIDGSMAIAVPAKKVSIPKVTAPAGDMAGKLKKLKKLYEAELISEEEYKEKKKAILEAM